MGILTHLFECLRPPFTCFCYKIGQNTPLNPTPGGNAHCDTSVGIQSVNVNYSCVCYTALMGQSPLSSCCLTFRRIHAHFACLIVPSHTQLLRCAVNAYNMPYSRESCHYSLSALCTGNVITTPAQSATL